MHVAQLIDHGDMRVSDLITDPMLRLELATPSSPAELSARVSSAVATESIDPASYLSPGALIMTTGMALNFDDPRIWSGYVERLVGANVAALAFGLGKPHSDVPSGLSTAAKELELPILGIPSDVPFLRLQSSVQRALAEEEFQASHLGWNIAEECTGLATEGADLDTVLSHVSRRAGVNLAVVDDVGSAFATGNLGPHHGIGSQQEPVSPPKTAPTLSLPLSLGGAKWQLRCTSDDETTSEAQLRTVMSPAAAVLSMILVRILESPMWDSAGSNSIARVLERSDEAASRDLETVLQLGGIDLARGARLISVRSQSAVRVHLLTWRLMRLFDEQALVTPIEIHGTVLLIVTRSKSDQVPDPLANEQFGRALENIKALATGDADSIVISELLQKPRAMILFSALHSPARPGNKRDHGVHLAGAPTLPGIIDLIPALYTEAISEALLDPVLSSPRAHELLESLTVLIDTTSIAHAATRLKVHRNTARTHRNELEELLGIDLSEGSGRSICAIALASLSRDHL